MAISIHKVQVISSQWILFQIGDESELSFCEGNHGLNIAVSDRDSNEVAFHTHERSPRASRQQADSKSLSLRQHADPIVDRSQILPHEAEQQIQWDRLPREDRGNQSMMTVKDFSVRTN